MKHVAAACSFLAPLLLVAASAAQSPGGAPSPPPPAGAPTPPMPPGGPGTPPPPPPHMGPQGMDPPGPPGMHHPGPPGMHHPGPPGMHHPEPRRLLSTGVTLGLALSVEFGKFLPNSAVAQEHLQVTTMPYVVLAPAYWFSPRALGTYCAAAGTVPSPVQDMLAKDAGVERRSACAAHMFGVYVGRAFAYDAKTTLTLGTPKTRLREVDPHVSVGVAFVPLSPLSLLLGVTLSDVTRDDGTAARLVTPHLALGLNFDALTMISGR